MDQQRDEYRQPMGTGRFIGLLVLSFLVPPLSVGIEYGCSDTLTIELLLWIFIPFGGFIYAIYAIIKARKQSRTKSPYPLAEEGRARPTAAKPQQTQQSQPEKQQQQPQVQPQSRPEVQQNQQQQTGTSLKHPSEKIGGDPSVPPSNPPSDPPAIPLASPPTNPPEYSSEK